MGQLPGEPGCDSRWGHFVGAECAHAHAQPYRYDPGNPTEFDAGDPKPCGSFCHAYTNIVADEHIYPYPYVNLDPHRDFYANPNGDAYRDVYADSDSHTKPVKQRASSRLYEMEPYSSSFDCSGPDRFGLWAACIAECSVASQRSCRSGR